ncbi:ATP-binding protein [Flammeovirga sp. EKP202]|uniref:hybrid sensor histidine kinase/response regulator n=1 Tax=Flammeovirga sp. EKP202 TaxID=2770592 RepID=UPI00165FC73C|nr:ATP-binding protein [Flammeovirga sp. EKP202]MBD0400897.1 response regulator [Flammeovirga sp. EKP202]
MFINSFLFAILITFFTGLVTILISMYVRLVARQKKTIANGIRNFRMLNLLMEHSSDVVFSVDKSYNYLAFNNAHMETMYSVYGKRIEIGKNILDYMRVKNDADVAENDIKRALEGEKYSVIRSYGDEQNFTRAHFEATYSPIFSRDDVVGVSVVVRNVTEYILSQENLKRSERKYKQLFHYNYLGALIIKDNTIIDANDTATHQLGLETHDLLGMSFEELFGIGELDITEREQIVKFPKLERVFNLRKETIGDEKNLQDIVFIDNITEKYAAEQALIEAHQQTKVLIESAKSYIFSIDTDFKITSYNTKFGDLIKNLLHIDIKEDDYLNSEPYSKLFEYYSPHFKRAFHQKEIFETEFQFDNNIFIQSVFSPLVNVNDEIYAIAVYNLDITEKWKHELQIKQLNSSLEQKVKERTFELNQQKLKLDLALNAAKIGAWSFTPEEGFTWDKKISRILGISDAPTPTPLKTFLATVVREERLKIISLFHKIFLGQLHNVNISAKINHSVRGVQYIQIYGKSRMQNGNYEMHGVCWNLTQQKKVEFELKEARNAAEKSNKAKSMFLANISHEIRSPLNAIIGLSNVLYRKSFSENLSEEFIEQLRYIYFNGEYLSELINNILDYSRIDAGKMQIFHERIDIRSFINLVVKIHTPSAHEKEVVIHTEVSDNVPTHFVTDSTKFRQVLTNLLTNAIKFTKEKTEIKIIVSANSECLQLSVHDQGIGISEDRIDVIFDSFEQADNSVTREYGGTGLGLAISKKLVEMLKGQIRVYSIEGEGATFIVQLPIIEGDRNEILEENGREAEVAFDADSKVLIVEDNKMNQFMMKALFKQLSLNCDIAENGEEAIKYIKESECDLILMDLHMPILGGIETAEKLRQELNVTTPIVALSADAYWDRRFHAFAVGINDYLTKPLDRNDLINTLKKYLIKDQVTKKYFDPKEHKELIEELKELTTATSLSVEHKLSRLKSIYILLQEYDTGFSKYIDYLSEAIASDSRVDVF